MTHTADLQRSKRLKELGWEQRESSFYWIVEVENPDCFWVEDGKRIDCDLYNYYCCPTAGEMIEWLLGEEWRVEIDVDSIWVQEQDPLGKCRQIFYKDNLCNAIADACAWVMERKI